MPSATAYGLFVLAALVLLLIPGPAVLYIVGRSVDQGRTAGLASVLGVSTGTLIQVAFATAGLSALVLGSSVAFGVVKYIGAAYLIVLGIMRFRERDEVRHERTPRSLRRLYTQGVIVNALNPKTALFIFALLPQFVDTGAGRVWLQVLVLGLTLTMLGLVCDGTYAMVAGTVAERLRRSRFQRWFGATVLIGLGIAAAAVSRPTSR